MDKKRILSFALVFLLIMQIFTVPFAADVSAATKNGLQKVNGKVYFYAKGKKVTNKWKNVGAHRYYFGKNGAAYKGYKKIKAERYYFDKNCRMVRNKVVTIGKNRYYFTANGSAVKQTVCLPGSSKIWTVTKGGKLVKNITSYAKNGKDFDAFIKKAGKPKSGITSPSCMGPGRDGIYQYSNFTIYTYEENGVRKILSYACV